METRSSLNEKLFANIASFKRLAASFMQREDGEGYLPPSQGELLFLVFLEQPISLKALAKAMRLTPGAITQLVEALERLSYIKRIPSADDRRVIHVVMTEAGTHKIRTFRQQQRERMKLMTSILTDEEVRTMIAIQSKMIAYLKQQCDTASVVKAQHAQRNAQKEEA